jgi:hypothetical protein
MVGIPVIRGRATSALLSTSLIGAIIVATVAGASAQSDPLPDAAWFAVQLQQHVERENRAPVALDSSAWVDQLQQHFEREHAGNAA